MGRRRAEKPKGHGRRIAVVSLSVLAVVVATALLLPRSLDLPGSAPDAERSADRHATPVTMVRKETRPTLDPARFTGMAAGAYQVAREIPEVLDQLHCYCACGNEYGHVSLLSCYTDGHAAT